MEDVLDVYHRPYDEKRPLVCLDEASKQLIGEAIEPIARGRPRGCGLIQTSSRRPVLVVRQI